MQSKLVIVWTVPVATAAITIAGNVWMALVYSNVLLRLGVLGSAPLAYGWILFFGLLGLNNMLAMVLLARWIVAHQREQALRDEVLAAVRWRSRANLQTAKLEEGLTRSVACRAIIAPAPHHVRYSVLFLATIVAPASLLGAIALS